MGTDDKKDPSVDEFTFDVTTKPKTKTDANLHLLQREQQKDSARITSLDARVERLETNQRRVIAFSKYLLRRWAYFKFYMRVLIGD